MLRTVRPARLLGTLRPAPRLERRALFGLSFPTPSNEPLAGTLDGSGPPWLFLAQVIIALPTVLWTYKCLIMVLFQRRLVYLPSVPPASRNETLEERKDQLAGMVCHEVDVRSCAPSRWLRREVLLKGLQLSWKEAEENSGATLEAAHAGAQPDVLVVYLQGNAGTPLHRIPLFSRLLSPPAHYSSTRPRVTLLAVAPRSFWRSTRSAPTQRTLLSDYTSIITHARLHFPTTPIVLYGHSIGGAISIILLTLAKHPSSPPLAGVILENPLPSIPYVVRALYPQKWLPYHYLGRFVFDRWDASGALERPSPSPLPRSLWIRSGQDEIIPKDVEGGEGGVRRMFERWSGEKRWVDVPGALHDTAFLRARWKNEIRTFLDEVVREDREARA